MSHRILITGASGYLGGTLLAHWKEAQLPSSYDKLFALVRTPSQANAVKQYGAQPVTIDAEDPLSTKTLITTHQITIVFHLHNAIDTETAAHSIAGLGQVKRLTGLQTHFLFTTGAKLFSEFAGMPIDRVLLDTDAELYELQKRAIGHTPVEFASRGLQANCSVIEAAEKHGVRSYIFAPCIVYGSGEGFGNKISIQTVAVVKAARQVGGVYRVDQGRPTWPVCHVLDNTRLYIELLRGMLEGRDMGCGKEGYYLAATGSVSWDDLYEAFGRALKMEGVVDDATVKDADDAILEKMAEGLDSRMGPVRFQVGGW